jgi:alkylated DNA nucleotide flippase Atl1
MGRAAFSERVGRALAGLRPGEVVTYGEVAEEVGTPGAARAVGNVLARSSGLPWWRVVAADGRLVPGHEAEQARRLAAEGVVVRKGRVVPGSRDPAGPPTFSGDDEAAAEDRPGRPVVRHAGGVRK